MRKFNRFLAGLVILLIGIAFLSPIYILLVNSFKNRSELYQNVLAFPSHFNFSNFSQAMQQMNFLIALKNSLIITIISVFFIVMLSSMTAWVLVRHDNKLSKVIFMILVATMIIPFQTLMMPLMQLMNEIQQLFHLKMMDSRGGLIYMNIGFHAAMSVFLYHGFIKSIPVSLEEAATIDGCSRFGIFWRIVFPMLKPITATVIILNVIGIWNDYLLPSLVLSSENLRTIPLSTFFFFGEFTIQWNLAMAGLVLTIIPVVIFYVLSQKYIIKGIGEGAIK
ncbi:carbohydrate ABC transporter permease [Pullulanibacillus sp. KACC 23026]|uniref:carbohydrate ABC transporter permease n=1 Tax=Pullulanibacillus sp. KACC 23026 TaxID=3028315 RepID=UPI0023AF551F|nr:carbohydrate ABC transporter permease [Pullulanibacillus sp. KACC 23026]WEG12207.1 carbohydrate ABC transporter permease [Pullulanibacillus sp. KACC 23026]